MTSASSSHMLGRIPLGPIDLCSSSWSSESRTSSKSTGWWVQGLERTRPSARWITLLPGQASRAPAPFGTNCCATPCPLMLPRWFLYGGGREEKGFSAWEVTLLPEVSWLRTCPCTPRQGALLRIVRAHKLLPSGTQLSSIYTAYKIKE